MRRGRARHDREVRLSRERLLDVLHKKQIAGSTFRPPRGAKDDELVRRPERTQVIQVPARDGPVTNHKSAHGTYQALRPPSMTTFWPVM